MSISHLCDLVHLLPFVLFLAFSYTYVNGLSLSDPVLYTDDHSIEEVGIFCPGGRKLFADIVSRIEHGKDDDNHRRSGALAGNRNSDTNTGLAARGAFFCCAKHAVGNF